MNTRTALVTALAILALVAVGPAARAGVYAHYDFDADYTDDSGNARHGTLVDVGTLANSGITTTGGEYVFGGGALNLSTDRDYVDLTTTTFGSGTAYTIAFWAKKAPTTTNDAADWDMVIGQRTNTNHFIAPNSTGDYVRWRGNDSSSARQLDASYPGGGFDDEQWHFYAVTASTGGTVSIYIDGALAGSGGSKLTGFSYDTIGDAYSTTAFDFYGQIDEVWVFDQTLTSTQVAGLGLSNLAPVTLNASDGGNSFNTGLHWDNGAAPDADHDYYTGAFTLRTPDPTGDITFAGNSLTIDAGGALITKPASGATITINDLRLNGGIVYLGNSTTFTLAGGITALDGTTSTFDTQGSGRVMNVTAAIGGTGDIVKAASGTLVYHAVNTYTGDTTVNAGSLSLLSTSEMRFLIEDAGVSNSILGSGAVSLDGLLRLDVSQLTDKKGVWNLVNVGSLGETWGSNFGLAFVGGPGFDDLGGGLYAAGIWSFDQATGNLTLIPTPAALPAGLAMLGLAACRQRRRTAARRRR